MRAVTSVALIVVAAVGLGACAPNRGDEYTKSLAEARRAHTAGRFADAAAKYDDAAKQAKIPRDAIYMRYEAALARARAGDVARAATELRAIATAKPPNAYSAQAAFKAADLAIDSDAAAGHAELAAIPIEFPDSGVAQVSVVRLARWDDEHGGPGKAIERLDAMLPKVKGKNVEQTILYERAKRLAVLGKHEEARDAFLDIASRWPYPFGSFFDDSLYRASEMEEKLGRPREAVAHLENLLSHREVSSFMGSYERPRYIPAVLRIAKLYEEKLNDRGKAREALHRLYSEFKTSTLRDDALWREAELWRKDGDNGKMCDRLDTLASDFPDSRYVPCAMEKCPSIKRSSKSKAPKTCHAYLTREATPHDEETPNPTVDTVRPDDPK
jgi:tetratricopeptide (TPR) repeat protein